MSYIIYQKLTALLSCCSCYLCDAACSHTDEMMKESQLCTCATGKRGVDGRKQTAMPAVIEVPVASSSANNGLKSTAKLTKLLSADKQTEYIAAFGSQTKLPRTPLLPGH